MADCINALKEWTGKAKTTVVYDSTVDEVTHDRLFNTVKGKPNIAVVGFTTEGDVFGGFYSVAVTKQMKTFFDRNIFVFSFESHGRCMTPQKFAAEKWYKKAANVVFWKNSSEGFVQFGVDRVGYFFLGDEKSNSYCAYLSGAFEGLEDTTLSGQDTKYVTGPYHHCTRLVAVQLS